VKDSSRESLAARLRNLTAQLRNIDDALKTQSAPDSAALMKFRQVLDNTRMTAWTVNELLNARATKRNPERVLSFLAAERVRRFSQMVRDLCTDIEQQGVTWHTNGIQELSASVDVLHKRLGAMTNKSRARMDTVGNSNAGSKKMERAIS
jgi:hypothetical protein